MFNTFDNSSRQPVKLSCNSSITEIINNFGHYTSDFNFPIFEKHQTNTNSSNSTKEPLNSIELNIKNNLEIGRRLLEKDYKEIHSYVYPINNNKRRLNKYFANKINIASKQKADNCRKELLKELRLADKFSEVNVGTFFKTNNNTLECVGKNNNKLPLEFNKNQENSNSGISSITFGLQQKENLSTNEKNEIAKDENEINNKENFKINKENLTINIDNERNTEEDKELNIENNEEVLKNYNNLQQNKLRKGVLDIHLTDAERNFYLNHARKGPQFSDSVKKQNQKVYEEYEHFCNEMKLDPFPISPISSVSFFYFLSKSGRYNVGSIDRIVNFALLRLNMIITGKPVDPYTNACMRAEVASLYKDKSLRQPGDGMTPIITSDLKIILDKIPDIDPQKPMLASMFLFALATGSRASTVAGVKLCHLIHYYERKDKFGNYALTIVQDVRKSKLLKYKTVTISGIPKKKETLNLIYWMEIYLNKAFNTTIEDLVNHNKIHPEEYQQPLWPLSTASMSEALKRRTRNAGLNLKKIGMHSLRSGFLTSAILNNNKNENELRAVLENCAVIADWIPYSKAQLTYLKAATRQSLIATDIVGLTNTDETGMETTKATENFHQIKLSSDVKLRCYSFLVKRRVKELINFPTYYNIKNNRRFDTMYNYCLIRLSKQLFSTERLTYNKYRTRIIQYINKKIMENANYIDSISNKLLEIAKINNKMIDYVEDEKTNNKKSDVVKRNELLSKISGRRVIRARWSEEEIKIFNKGIEENKSLREISNLLFFRSYADCYDHLRSINKSRLNKNLPVLTVKKSIRKRRNEKTNNVNLNQYVENREMRNIQASSIIQNQFNSTEKNEYLNNNDERILEESRNIIMERRQNNSIPLQIETNDERVNNIFSNLNSTSLNNNITFGNSTNVMVNNNNLINNTNYINYVNYMNNINNNMLNMNNWLYNIYNNKTINNVMNVSSISNRENSKENMNEMNNNMDNYFNSSINNNNVSNINENANNQNICLFYPVYFLNPFCNDNSLQNPLYQSYPIQMMNSINNESFSVQSTETNINNMKSFSQYSTNNNSIYNEDS